MQPVHRLQHPQIALSRLTTGFSDRDPDREFGDVGQELVQRRIQQPDRHRQPVHRLEDALEVLPLQRQQLGKFPLAFLVGVGQDQSLHQRPPVTEEHVLGPTQPDALRTEPAGPRRVLLGVRVGPHRHPPGPIRDPHQPVHRRHQLIGIGAGRVEFALEIAHDRRRNYRHLAQEHLTGGAVDRDQRALRMHRAILEREMPRLGVHIDRLGATHAGLAHPPGDHRRVAGLTAPAGQDPLRCDHPVQIIGIGLPADENHLLPGPRPLDRGVGIKDHLADCGAG